MTRRTPLPTLTTVTGSVIDTSTLSGNAYISVIMRDGTGERSRIPLVAATNCDHTYTICPTAECLNSWSLDYRLFMRRTGGGRKLTDQFHLTDAALVTLMAPEYRDIHPSNDPFDATYDDGIYDRTLTNLRWDMDAKASD